MSASENKVGEIAAGNRGRGRKKGVPNKSTASIKEAITTVYAKLQESTGEAHGHFLGWAEENPTEFYKLASKLIPLDVKHSGNVDMTLKASRDAAVLAATRANG